MLLDKLVGDMIVELFCRIVFKECVLVKDVRRILSDAGPVAYKY